MIKYVSFDLDGTLADENFDNLVWNEEIPRLYAAKKRISLGEAKKTVYAEYYKSLYMKKVKRWTDVSYWFRIFGLRNWRKLLEDMKKHIFIYPDTVETLKYLSRKYKLVLVSSADKRFLEMKLKADGIGKYFTHVFSAPNTFGIPKKNKLMFERILGRLKIRPEEMVHIGNDHYIDYEVPSSLGIRSYHLVREKKVKEKHAIHSLLELKNLL